MNRKEFFKRLGITAAGVTFIPRIVNGEDKLFVEPTKRFIVDTSLIPEGFTLKDWLKIYDQHGILLTDDCKVTLEFTDPDSGIQWTIAHNPKYDGPLDRYISNPNYKIKLIH